MPSARSREASRTSSSRVGWRAISKVGSLRRSPTGSMCTQCASPSAWSRRSRRSTSRPWSRCG
jgi:hypothetical protein